MPWLEQLQSAHWGAGSSVALGAYLLGCFATGYYLVRFRTGQDIRELGSGNIGARNVGRVLGKTAFFLTVAGDVAKGAFAVWAATRFRAEEGLGALALLAVVTGHLWPVQLGFRGGKGVATSLGALALYDFHLAFAFAVCFALAAAVMRKTVLPGLLSFICLPFVSSCMEHGKAEVVELSVLAGLIVLAHRKNLVEEFSQWLERRSIHAKHEQSDL
jgi:acyl phosphate:glycerol-3-phosphate acyltransferase